MLIESALAAVAKRILDHAAGGAIGAAEDRATARVRAVLRRDAQTVACQAALARTQARFARAHPRWHAALFDEAFLAGRAAPLLAESLTGADPDAARRLAEAWAETLGGDRSDRVRELEPLCADLLDWWHEELRRHEAFRAVLDSKSIDAILDVSEATASEVRALREDVLAALGAASGPAGAAAELDRFIDWPSRQRVTARRLFVGRDWIFDAVAAFEAEAPAGYFSVVAAAGLGKTALAAAVAERYDAPAYFFSQSAGRVDGQRCLDHLSAELVARRGLDPALGPARTGGGTSGFGRALEAAVEDARPVWVVIDALDEADPTRRVGLPEELPEGAFVLLTHRPGPHAPPIAPQSRTASRTLHVGARDPRQQADVVAYLRDHVEQEPAYRPALASLDPPSSAADFVRTLAAASEGNFMYLAYVLDDLASGTRLPFRLDELPAGLEGYYSQMWEALAGSADRDWSRWEQLERPAIELLAVAGEPVEIGFLGDHLGRPPAEIRRRILQRWQRFLQQVADPPAWQIVHQSFTDFLATTQEVDLREAHRRVAAYYLEDPARWTAHGGYARRHLTGHLRAAGDGDRLHELVTSAAWREHQLAHDPGGGALLDDVANAWTVATDEDATARARGEALPRVDRELSYAMTTAELRSSATQLPGVLVRRAAETGVWSIHQAYAAVMRTGDHDRRAAALADLAPVLPDELLAEAVQAVRETAGPAGRAVPLARLVGHLSGAAREQAIEEAVAALDDAGAGGGAAVLLTLAPLLEPARQREIVLAAVTQASLLSLAPERATALARLAAATAADGGAEAVAALLETLPDVADPDVRADALVTVSPHLPGDLRGAALAAAHAIPAVRARAAAVAAVLRGVPPDERTADLRRVLEEVDDLRNPRARAEALTELALVQPQPEAERMAAEALALLRDTPDTERKVACIVRLATAVPAEARDPLLADATETARRVREPAERARALADVAARLTGGDRATALDAALVSAAEVQHSDERSEVLADVVLLLDDQQVRKALSAADALAEPAARAQVLTCFAPHLDVNSRDDALNRAFEAARVVPAARVRADLMAVLAEMMPPERSAQAYDVALVAARSLATPRARAEVLEQLARRSVPAAVEEIVADAVTLAQTPAGGRALALIAPIVRHFLPETRLVRLVEMGDDRLRLVAGLWPRLPPARRGEAVAAAVEGVFARGMWSERVAERARLLPPEALSCALGIAEIWDDVGWEQRATVAELLAPDDVAAARRAALAETAEPRAHILCALALRADAPPSASEEAYAAVREIEHDERRIAALAALARAGRLPERGYRESASDLARVTQARVPIEAVLAVAEGCDPQTRSAVLEQAFEEAMTRPFASARRHLRELSAIGADLPRDLAYRFLERVRSDQGAGRFAARNRGRVLMSLAPRLDEQDRADAVGEALGLLQYQAPYEADLLELATPHLDVRNVVSAAEGIPDAGRRAHALSRVVSQLAEPDLPAVAAAFDAARLVQGHEERARALTQLLPHLEEDERAVGISLALRAARAARDPVERAKLHVAVLHALTPAEQAEHVQATAELLADAYPAEQNPIAGAVEALGEDVMVDAFLALRPARRALALLALGDRLPQQHVHHLLSTAAEAPSMRVALLHAAAPRLSPADGPRALGLAASIGEHRVRLAALESIVHVPGMATSADFHRAVAATLREAAHEGLGALAPFACRLGRLLAAGPG